MQEQSVEQRICVLALIGLPGAGKTTLSHWLMEISKTTPQSRFNAVHLCYDNLVKFPVNIDSEEYNMKVQRMEVLKLIKNLVESLRSTKSLPSSLIRRSDIKVSLTDSTDFLIICDDNNYYRSMRYKLFQFCKHNRCAYSQIYLDCLWKTALKRNLERALPERVPNRILQQMVQAIQPPDKQKNSWESQTLKLNTGVDVTALCFDAVPPFVAKSFDCIKLPSITDDMEQPVKKFAESVGVVHEFDLHLRRRIKELLNDDLTAEEKKVKAANLNAKRREILQKIKQDKGEHNADLNDLSGYIDLLLL